MSLLLTERRGRVAVLTFNDPDRRNAISDEMNAALDEAFDDLEADEEPKEQITRGPRSATEIFENLKKSSIFKVLHLL